MEKLSDRIIEFLRATKMSQSEIARKMGTSQSNISEIMNGKRIAGRGMANNLHLYLGANLEWLLTGKGNMFVDDLVVKDGEPDYKAMYFEKAKMADDMSTEIRNLSKKLVEKLDEIEKLKDELEEARKSLSGVRSA